jgi:exodeoxyribonuclease VII large subunit
MKSDELEQVTETYNIPRDKIITVTELNQYLSRKISEDAKLHTVYVLGEISNVFKSGYGHLFFTLKEEEASIKCIVYSSIVHQLDYVPEDGKEVLIKGNINAYIAKAECEINVEKVMPVGEGLIYHQIQKLKDKLEKEGLFKPEYKKPIPLIPATVGIVSSQDGSATQDMIRTLVNHFPNVQIEIRNENGQ